MHLRNVQYAHCAREEESASGEGGETWRLSSATTSSFQCSRYRPDDVSVSDYTVRNPSESATTNSLSLSISISFLLLLLLLSLSLARRLTGSANAFPDGMRLVCAPRGLPSKGSVDFHFTQPPHRRDSCSWTDTFLIVFRGESIGFVFFRWGFFFFFFL